MGASGLEGDDATEAPRALSTPRLATRGRLGYAGAMKSPFLLSCSFLLLAAAPSPAQSPARWKAHDMARPRPPVVAPARQALPVPAPPDALLLFDGTSLAEWRSADGGPAKWVIKEGAIESVPGSGYLYSARGFGDVQLHVEWGARARAGRRPGPGEQRRVPDGALRGAGARFVPERHLPRRTG